MFNQVHDVDLQLLRLFVCVVECGGFSAAQGELRIGQSTISTQMAKLETRLGYRLCERGKAGFRLTPKGELVLQATRNLFSSIEVFKSEAQGMADKLLGELSIGLSEALDSQVIERISHGIGCFRKRNQDVQIKLLSAMPAELERRLLQNQLHLAISYFSGQQSALNYHPLFEEQQRLYCGKGHPLFGVPHPGQMQLSACDGVLHPYRFTSSVEAFKPNYSSVSTEQVEGSLAFILSGAHIGYLPRHVAAPWQARGLLQVLGPATFEFSVQFHLANHSARQPSEAQQALVEDLLMAFAEPEDV